MKTVTLFAITLIISVSLSGCGPSIGNATGGVVGAGTSVPLPTNVTLFPVTPQPSSTDTPVPQAKNVYEGVAYYIQNLRLDTKDPTGQPAKEGWQYASFDILLENTTPAPIWYPSTNTRSAIVQGKLTDSGGYARDFAFTVNDQSGWGFSPVRMTNSYIPLLLIPGVRTRYLAYTSLPSAYSPSSINLLQNGQVMASFDTKSLDTALDVPFKSLPSGISVLTPDQTIDYSSPGKYRIKLSGFRFATYTSLVCDAELENLGGDDINGIPGIEREGPAVFISTSNGYYSYGGLSNPQFASNTVAPGMKKSIPGIKLADINGSDYRYIWIALAPNVSTPPSVQFLISMEVGKDKITAQNTENLIPFRGLGYTANGLPYFRNGLGLSPDSKLVGAAAGKVVRIFDIQSGKEVKSFNLENSKVIFSPDFKYFALRNTSTIYLYDVESGAVAAELDADTSSSYPAAFAPDSKSIAVMNKGKIDLYDIPSGKKTGSLQPQEGCTSNLSFSNDGKLLACADTNGNNDQVFTVWDVSKQATSSSWKPSEFRGWINWVHFSPDGKYAYLSTGLGTLWKLELSSQQGQATEGSPSDFSLSPDGSLAFFVSGSSIIDLSTGQRLFSRESIEFLGVSDAAFSEDGTYAVSSGDNGIIVWAVRTSKIAVSLDSK